MPNTLTPAELHARLNRPDGAIELHREAIQAGVPFGRYLETQNPSDNDDRLDAFQRQLKHAGIVTRSDPQAGYWASEAGAFFDSVAGRALLPEFFAREWRKVAFATPQERAIVLSSDAVVNTWERPYTDAAGPRWNNQFQPPIPMAELVAITTPITGEDYRSLYMTYDAEALRLFRVGESAEIPMANLATSARSIRLKKYGRGMRTSYEALRRMRVDRFAWWIRWMAVQSEVDKVAAALTVLVSGDGNSGTAATEIDMTDLDSGATPGTLSLRAWLNFRLQFAPPYSITTALMTQATALQLILMNVGTANLPLAGYSFNGVGNQLTPINATADAIRYGWTSEAPTAKIVGFDARAALEQVVEIGSEIQETERFITNQTQVVTMTENNGFAILDPASAKILDLAE